MACPDPIDGHEDNALHNADDGVLDALSDRLDTLETP